jgi:regulator of protease activity HflC (stomatin/prohibitin superfamily)
MVRTLLLSFILIIFLLNCVYRVREDERFAVFRFGRFSRVKGPGWIFLLPGLEKKFRISLNRHFPGWRGLTKGELAEKIRIFITENK